MEAGWSASQLSSLAAIQDWVETSLGVPVSSRTIRRLLAEGHLGLQCPLHVLPLMPTHQCLHLEWCHAQGNWTSAKWNQVVISDESRFNLSSNDNHLRVWRPCGERLNPAFALQRHTAPTAGVMLRGAIAYNTWSPLVLICGTMTAQRYVRDILQPRVATHATVPRSHFSTRHCSASHGKGVTTVPSRLLPFLGLPDPTSLNKLEARLQQIWNEMSQDIIQNLYSSMPDCIALCICARGDSTEY
ncbi:transposable element Tcb2 transposase [Trichonephila clavipes]|uniref:Transposable element Tcb2 transposase n=1 Tax=Trichonephila clavipes TaxID=2585209 RepID=A0A8X6SDR1_TRICX|nr:transposable element Tcb2 transposase [Trichonephila clavipes]